jgi:hypothetical protein
MPSIKQLQSRLLNKKHSMNKVNSNMTTAEKGNNRITLKRLAQGKVSLDKDIKKLERQLVMEIRASREKKDDTTEYGS